MALSEDEKKTLAALQAKENEPEPDDEFIEIWDDTGAGAKVKRSSAKNWLNKFGIDLDEVTTDEETEDKPVKKSPAKKTTSDGNVTHAAKYFGNKNAG